jgi:hypothetical protein
VEEVLLTFKNQMCRGMTVLAGAILFFPFSAFATLGGTESSVDVEQKNLHGVHTKTQTSQYTVHEVKASTTLVHEYVSLSGTVFAVTWRGAARPDLQALFGAYYDEYSQARAKQSQSHGRRAMFVKAANVTVGSSGHMRDLRGKAYVPALVPAGVNVESLP